MLKRLENTSRTQTSLLSEKTPKETFLFLTPLSTETETGVPKSSVLGVVNDLSSCLCGLCLCRIGNPKTLVLWCCVRSESFVFLSQNARNKLSGMYTSTAAKQRACRTKPQNLVTKNNSMFRIWVPYGINMLIFRVLRGVFCKKGPQNRVFQQILSRSMWSSTFFSEKTIQGFHFLERCHMYAT